MSRKTQLLREPDALQLAGGALRNLGEKENLAWDLEIRQTFGCEFPQVFLTGLETFAQDHGGSDILTQFVVRH